MVIPPSHKFFAIIRKYLKYVKQKKKGQPGADFITGITLEFRGKRDL
jgi:hypothetical protein